MEQMEFVETEKTTRASRVSDRVKKFLGMDVGTKPSAWKPPVVVPDAVPEEQESTIYPALGKQKETTKQLEDIYTNLLQAESGSKQYDSKGKLITSNKGAEGISQVMPKTQADPGFGVAPAKDKSEAEFLRVGKDYLKAMYNRYNDWELALAAYNAGPGNVDKALSKSKKSGEDWKEHLPVKQETIPYIDKILGTRHWDKFKSRHVIENPKKKDQSSEFFGAPIQVAGGVSARSKAAIKQLDDSMKGEDKEEEETSEQKNESSKKPGATIQLPNGTWITPEENKKLTKIT